MILSLTQTKNSFKRYKSMAKIILRNSDCIFAVSINIQTIDHVLLHK